MLLSRGTTAGRSAENHFRTARDAWRRRVVRRVQPFLLVPAFAIYAAQVAAGGDLLSWSLGLAAGALLAGWLCFRDSPPQHIARWHTGAEGERRTARALRPLRRAGWTVVHDVAAERGNRDHVVVGPGGVFLVDTKRLSGVLSVRGDVVHADEPDNPRAARDHRRLAGGVRGAAAQLSRELQRLTGEPVWVQAVVVLWGDFPAGTVEGDRVSFVAGERAAAWFGERPRVLVGERLEPLAAAVAGLPSAT